jgi:hypothetical protein
MRLYLVTDGHGSDWEGTQDDAKRKAREYAAKWDQVEVPTDKAGLLNFLNELPHAAILPTLGIAAICEDPIPVDRRDPPQAEPNPAAAQTVDQTQTFTARQICDFILDVATVAQVENIMGCLGTRVAELAKEKRNYERH